MTAVIRLEGAEASRPEKTVLAPNEIAASTTSIRTAAELRFRVAMG